MKRTIRFCAAIAIITTLIMALCACSSSFAGTWYCADDVDGETPLTLTSDGKFNFDGVGGEYSVENGQVVLVSSWESSILTVDKINGKTCLVDEDGGIWFNSQKAAHDYYEKETQKKIEAVESLCFGTYSLNSDWSEYFATNNVQLTLNNDYTYKYIYKGILDDPGLTTHIYLPGGVGALCGPRFPFDAVQTGTWSLGYQGTILDGSVCIIMSPKKSSGYDESTLDNWISENTPGPFIRNILVNQNDEEILSGWNKN